MEAYKTTCPECKHVRFWIGYKTSLGKSPEQITRMKEEETTCVKCGSKNADTELDRESPDGLVYAAATKELIKYILPDK